jgi:hypothetical protein
MVFVGKASPGPAQDWHMNVAQGLYHVIADASGVRNLRVFSDPNPVIDAPTHMFSKVAIDMLIDTVLALVCMDNEMIQS